MAAQRSTIGLARPVERRCDLREQVRHFLCGLTGHDSVLTFDGGNRLALKCQTCGYQSPGIDNSDIPKATRRYEGDPDRLGRSSHRAA